ncbi:hypothetical protein GQ457_13G005950 [Hibiscus cannabinus]
MDVRSLTKLLTMYNLLRYIRCLWRITMISGSRPARSGSVVTVTGLIRFRVNISRLQIRSGSLQPRVKPGSDSIGFQSGFQVGSAFYIPKQSKIISRVC